MVGPRGQPHLGLAVHDPPAAKCAFLLVVSAWTAYAVHNNLTAIDALGLSPLGGTL
jgi:hypothetical protein